MTNIPAYYEATTEDYVDFLLMLRGFRGDEILVYREKGAKNEKITKTSREIASINLTQNCGKEESIVRNYFYSRENLEGAKGVFSRTNANFFSYYVDIAEEELND